MHLNKIILPIFVKFSAISSWLCLDCIKETIKHIILLETANLDL